MPNGIVIPPGTPPQGIAIAQFLGATLFAVRSSAPDEDGSASSMAGQFSTVLDVEGHDLDDVVESVRRGREDSADGGVIPVIVQRMVDPLFAGVGFSIDPVSGDGDVTTIEVVAGLGDRVTDGSASPTTVQRRLGVDGAYVTEFAGDAPPLAVTKMCDLVDDLAEWLGVPVDVEFASDTSTMWLLQVRPVTAVGFGGIDGVWTSANLRDSLTDTVSTLTATTTLELTFPAAVNAAVRSIMKSDRSDMPLVTARPMYAKPYWRVDRLRAQLQRLPGHDARVFDTSVGIEHDPHAVESRQGWLRAFRYPSIVVRGMLYARRIQRDAESCVARNENVDWAVDRHRYQGSPRTLSQRLREALATHHQVYLLSMQVSLIAEQALDALRVCAESASTDGAPTIHPSEMMSDLGVLATNRGATALADLANRHRASARVILAASSVDDLPAPVRADLEQIAEQWGYLSFCDDELSNPRWDEDLNVPLALLQANLRTRSTRTLASTVASRHTSARQALLSGPLYRRPLLALILRHARSWAVLREAMRACAARHNYLVRKVCLELGDQLVDSHRLTKQEDVFWLTRDEVLLASTLSDTGDLSLYADNRRRRASTFRNWVVPDTIRNAVGQSEQGPQSAAVHSRTELAGIGCSYGVAEGPARVVDTQSDLAAVTENDILVVRTINPGWAGVFGCASGLVSESGGMLSHGSILAREQGLPAVVGVRGATTRITTGDIIRIDGTTGEVVRR
ncbi:PEP/pyruvate-binding domain-containing protein [Rhodococcus tibetensis]|uniref:PEP-utilizing enzyme n=1 Tax=Rhodococcus tibetensis TaxID=2965064 RepID=A0ABT1QB47_9NOCA|nr:PEP/pyruvate-binding domain-containing protein [Rhodococcus sp. FXJ9.536]MCQ4118933.1 PEP-utilizing enzyme [Rhodococcus sp. FXJ9.536]